MDRKTLFSSLFAAIVVASAAVKTAVDPDLRGLFVRMLSRPIPPPPEHQTFSRPTNWPGRLEVVVDPRFPTPRTPWFGGKSFEGDTLDCVSLGYGDFEKETRYSAWIEPDGVLVLTLAAGPWFAGMGFGVRMAHEGQEASLVEIGGSEYSDVVIVDENGESQDSDLFNDIVGRVTINSSDWSVGRTIGVHLHLAFSFDANSEHWCEFESRGAVKITTPPEEAK